MEHISNAVPFGMNMQGFITGSKLHLRPLEMADIDRGYYHWFNDPEITRYMFRGAFPVTRESAIDFLQKSRNSTTMLHFAIVDTETNTHIGCCSLEDIDWINRVAESNIIIGEKGFHGRGYGKEAKYILARHGFQTLNLHRIFVGLHADNIAERRANEWVGFQVEGTLRQAMFKDGQYHDRIIMSILPQELRHI